MSIQSFREGLSVFHKLIKQEEFPSEASLTLHQRFLEYYISLIQYNQFEISESLTDLLIINRKDRQENFSLWFFGPRDSEDVEVNLYYNGELSTEKKVKISKGDESLLLSEFIDFTRDHAKFWPGDPQYAWELMEETIKFFNILSHGIWVFQTLGEFKRDVLALFKIESLNTPGTLISSRADECIRIDGIEFWETSISMNICFSQDKNAEDEHQLVFFKDLECEGYALQYADGSEVHVFGVENYRTIFDIIQAGSLPAPFHQLMLVPVSNSSTEIGFEGNKIHQHIHEHVFGRVLKAT